MVPNRRSRPGKLQRVCFKTRLCQYYDANDASSCRVAENCFFAHSVDELCEVPDLARTRTCRQYAEGSCKDGSNCIFAHGELALRIWPAPQAPRPAAIPQNEVGRGSAASFRCSDSEMERFLGVPPGSVATSSSATLPHGQPIENDSHAVEFAASPRGGNARASPLPCVPYQPDASAANNVIGSLLEWPEDERQVLHASGHHVYRKNTFLIIADSPRQSDEMRRCWSLPWMQMFQ
eukprot:TRINITY_DN26779_c0_g1_i2.p1 TRINITY_DN26779_c0_g1~~TRINITY_DN26779_c0_g1_i2.p1  ORF type:complete len:259 (+),score=0.61 TRINITY_DN26779_c0_g1_i2:75-779(+)